MYKIFKFLSIASTFGGTITILYLNHYNGNVKVVLGAIFSIGILLALKWLVVWFKVKEFCNKEGLVYDSKRDMQVPKPIRPTLATLWKYIQPLLFLTGGYLLSSYAEKNMQSLTITFASVLALFIFGLMCDLTAEFIK